MALKIKQDDKGMVNRKKEKDNLSSRSSKSGGIFHKEETVERK